ncbi:MAG TPA: family 10 glycosylhydrolase [Kiritimatiellia bacterium]|nr:family 10 glycosylhydrolase [Kiritimatiellia bacterium]
MRFWRVIVLLLALASSAGAAVLESFRYADDKALGSAWRAIGGSPAAQRTADGVAFRMPFDGDRDRVYWDRTVNLDLSPYTTIEFDLSVDRPDALRSLMIYFKSGDGWYVWGRALKTGGRQRLVLAKSDFSVEGKPAGWNRIEMIRISPWRGTPAAARLVAHRLEGRADRIFVVRSSVSSPNATERVVAERAADRVSRWLGGAGIRHAVLPEAQLTAAAIADSRLLILPYNARPTAAHLALYRKHVAAGGKLIVCFSESEALAELMGVSLGDAISHREPGRWAGFQFSNAPELFVPERVYQQSWGIRIATPLKGRGRVVAHWINAAGERQPEPAWISTDRGFWMTHILLDDDRAGKEQLLAGFVGALEPGAWADAAREAVAQAGKIDGYSSFAHSAEDIRKLAVGHPARTGIHALLDQAHAEYQALLKLNAERRHPEAVRQAATVRRLLGTAYSRAQTAPAREMRAVWDHDAVGWYPGDWDRTARELKAAGINTLFVNTLWAGLAHYPSKVVPGSHTSRRFGDQMKAALEAGRRHGLAVHAWVVLWHVGNAPPDFLAELRKAGRLQQDAAGAEVAWLNPAVPANRQHMLAAIEELARNYDVDGIHLDYVRYPSAQACFAPATRRAFEGWLKRTVTPWPAGARTGATQDELRRWRAAQITDFVRETRGRLRAVKPELQLSAAVWGGYPDTIASIGQDWGLWLREGYFDFVCPMNYEDDTFRFSSLTQRQLALPGARGRIIPGIGVTASESQLRADQVVEQIAIARRLGAPGFALYKLSQTLRQETLPLLREGTTR